MIFERFSVPELSSIYGQGVKQSTGILINPLTHSKTGRRFRANLILRSNELRHHQRFSLASDQALSRNKSKERLAPVCSKHCLSVGVRLLAQRYQSKQIVFINASFVTAIFAHEVYLVHFGRGLDEIMRFLPTLNTSKTPSCQRAALHITD